MGFHQNWCQIDFLQKYSESEAVKTLDIRRQKLRGVRYGVSDITKR